MSSSVRAALIAVCACIFAIPGAAIAAYTQTDLATHATDPDLVNPWGMSSGTATPFWVSNNGSGNATLYNGFGVKQGLIVTMPNADPITGQVFNGSTTTFGGNRFLFASEAGTIDGWHGGTTAANLFTVTDAVYKGLAISGDNSHLFAANFHSGAIDVFDSAGLTGSFSDPNAPAGYAPFNIQNLGGKFYVTFAQQDAAGEDDVGGVGHGFVDVFDTLTHTFSRLITGSAAGGTEALLNSPWGLALAPSLFGLRLGDLLIGNFGDGTINVFDPVTGASRGTLRDENGLPIVNLGLWGLAVGNAGPGFNSHALYFTAGGAAEDTGVFGRLDFILPEPGTLALLGVCTVALFFTRRKTS